MRYFEHARIELEHLPQKPSEGVQKAVFNLLEIFSKQGHSGSSAPYCIGYFNNFSNHRDIEKVKEEFLALGYTPIDQEQEDGPNKWIQENVLELLSAIQDLEGQEYTQVVEYFVKLALFKPLTPLTGEDWEWIQDEFDENVSYQNKRCFSVFKDETGIYDSNGRVFREPSGVCYINGKSRVYITFPYEPKKEIIDVPESEETTS